MGLKRQSENGKSKKQTILLSLFLYDEHVSLYKNYTNKLVVYLIGTVGRNKVVEV